LKDSRRRRRVFVTLSVLTQIPTKMSPQQKKDPKKEKRIPIERTEKTPPPQAATILCVALPFVVPGGGQGREKKKRREMILTSGKKQLNPSNKSSWPLSNFFTRLTTSAVSYLMRLEIGKYGG